MADAVDARPHANGPLGAAGARLRMLLAEGDRTLVSLASHELRTPLTSVKALAETLAMQHERGREVRMDFLPVIDQEADRLARMLDAMAILGRIAARELAFRFEQVAMHSLIESALAPMRPLLERNAIHVVSATADLGLTIEADKIRLAQALTALIEGATTNVAEGGCLLIRSRAAVQNGTPGAGVTILAGPREAGEVFERMVGRPEGPTEPEWGPPPLALVDLKLCWAAAEALVAAHAGEIQAISWDDLSGYDLFLPLDT